jgi:hypothetical protein
VFDDAESGAQYITIKKAIIEDHGTSTGWSNAYGDGQAIWSGSSNLINFIAGYYIWEGQKGSGGVKSSYGFRVTTLEYCDQNNRPVGMPGIGYSSYQVDHIQFSHTAISTCEGVADGTLTQIGIYSAPRDETYKATDLTISSNFFEGGSSNMFIRTLSNSTIENNYWTNQWSSPENHGQQISPGGNCDDIVFRNNIFYNSSVFVIGAHTDNNERWEVYNNLVIGGDNSSFSAVFANADSATPNVFLNSTFHHNTFVNVNCGGRGAVYVGTLSSLDNRSYAYNNLFYNGTNCGIGTSGTSGSVVSDYNAYYDSTGTMSPGVNGISTTGNPFVDSANGDYHLKAGTPAIDRGANMGSPYSSDFDGISRPQGSAWDMGAYEFVLGQQYHRSDTSQNGCVETNEMISFMNRWKISVSDVNMPEMMESIGLWKFGAGC